MKSFFAIFCTRLKNCFFRGLLGTLIFLNGALASPPSKEYKLRWFDDFNSLQLDQKKWVNYDVGPWKGAINTPDAISFQDGCLVITVYTEKGIHYSGMIATEGKLETKYGYWEARMKFSDAPGTFSDFWLFTRKMLKNWKPNTPFKTNGVEIDIVEHRSIDEHWNDISGINSINLHWGEYGEHHKWDGIETEDLKLGDGFHTFGLEWDPKFYRFYIDNKLVWEHTEAISEENQFVIFSTEVVNGGWSGFVPREGYGTKKTSNVRTFIDYFRYYAK